MSARNKSAIHGFAIGNYFQAGAGDLPGSAAFSAVVLAAGGFRLAASGTESLFANRGNASGWRIFSDGMVIGGGVFETTGGEETVGYPASGGLLAGDEFYHIAMVYDATTLELYVNGVGVDSEAVDGDIIPSALAPTIGIDRSAGGDALANPATNSFILGAAYIASELSATQIQNHYLNCKLAGRMVDAAAQNGYGVAAASPTFTHLYDAWFNNSNRSAVLGNAVTWLDRKTPAINFAVVGTPTPLAFR